ncbi:hypothetical protein Avbf_13747 [Armadillidium vulgare]|nr:hypothetical protein Avbf_13747 [Armadillidium vulgare]
MEGVTVQLSGQNSQVVTTAASLSRVSKGHAQVTLRIDGRVIPDFKIPSSGSNSSLSHFSHTNSNDGKNSWLRHKIKKAFHKSESKKEFSVASNLTTLASCLMKY